MIRKASVFAALLLATAGSGFAAQPPAPPAGARPAPGPGLTLTTSAWEDGGIIPNRYTASAAPAEPVSPGLTWTHAPANTVSYALIVVDPDISTAHSAEDFAHWVMFNIPGSATSLPEGIPNAATLPDGSVQLMNRFKKNGYLAPGMSAAGPYHHYTFQLFALDTKLALGADATRADVVAAMSGHVLAKGVLVGRFHQP